MVRTLSRRNLVAAASLATLAGFVDGLGFVFLGGYFVSFMSGNTTRASVAAVDGLVGQALLASALIVGFVAGSALGTFAAGRRARSETAVLVIVTVGIAASAVSAGTAPLVAGVLLATSMGAMNTVFSRGGEVSFGITYMTGALVKVGQGLVAAARGGRRWEWARHLLMWAAIAAGAVLGATGFRLVGTPALWAPVAALVVVLATPPLRRWIHP